MKLGNKKIEAGKAAVIVTKLVLIIALSLIHTTAKADEMDNVSNNENATISMVGSVNNVNDICQDRYREDVTYCADKYPSEDSLAQYSDCLSDAQEQLRSCEPRNSSVN
jgi:hypothetical protein